MPRLAFTPVGPKIEVLLALACRSPGRTDWPRSCLHENDPIVARELRRHN